MTGPMDFLIAGPRARIVSASGRGGRPSANNAPATATACVARHILGPGNYLAFVAKHCPVLYPSSWALSIVPTTKYSL